MQAEPLSSQSFMRREALEVIELAAAQLQNNETVIRQWINGIDRSAVKHILIVGRGSSDHAGVFAKYLFEIMLGIPVSSAALSVATLYDRPLQLKNSLVIAISQSGKSPDLLAQIEKCKEGGAQICALVNVEDSPLAKMADQLIPLGGGSEISVAATKSFLLTLSALLQIVAVWKQDKSLLTALDQLPEALANSAKAQPFLSSDALSHQQNLIVLGRGFGFAIANEMALKLKEVLSLHAESFSSAEFLHGPAALASMPTTVISVDVNDQSASAHQQIIGELKQRGVSLIHSAPVGQNAPSIIQPLLILLRFYLDLEQIATGRGLDVDNPPGLKKVTETL